MNNVLPSRFYLHEKKNYNQCKYIPKLIFREKTVFQIKHNVNAL